MRLCTNSSLQYDKGERTRQDEPQDLDIEYRTEHEHDEESEFRRELRARIAIQFRRQAGPRKGVLLDGFFFCVVLSYYQYLYLVQVRGLCLLVQ